MVNHYFLDTSALAKRYIPEIGTPWINRITTANHIILLPNSLGSNFRVPSPAANAKMP